MPVITATWVVEIRRIEFQGQPGQKVSKTPSQSVKGGHSGINRKTAVLFKKQNNKETPIKLAGHWWFMPVILATQEGKGQENGGLESALSKISNTKKGWRSDSSGRAPA
jgi:hypothetical protein